MGYTIKVNHPHFPEGTEMNIGGLGRAPNGGSVEVDEEMERLFMLQHGRSIDEAFANDGVMEVSGSSALDKSEVDSIKAMFVEPEVEESSSGQMSAGNIFGETVETTDLGEGGEE